MSAGNNILNLAAFDVVKSYVCHIGEYVITGKRTLFCHPYTLVLDGLVQETPEQGARRIVEHVTRDRSHS